MFLSRGKMGLKIVILLLVLGKSVKTKDITFSTSSLFSSGTAAGLTESKIVGGTQVDSSTKHPYMVALTVNLDVKTFFCGGSLLTTRTIMTAAHCIEAVYQSNGTLMSSVLATVGTDTWNSGGQSYSVDRNVTHPKATETLYDIGLFLTTKTIILSPSVQPVTLDFDYVGTGVKSIVAGWGRTTQSSDGPVSDVLLELTVTTIDNDLCVKEAAKASIDFNITAPAVDPTLEICTYHSPAVAHGTCNGDSGSALVRLDKKTQIGSVSWGFPCALGAPDMYVRISAFKPWINQYIVD